MNKAQLISALGKTPLVSKALRWYAGRFPEGSVTTIRSGLASGMKWRRHHCYVNGYWTGQYEYPMQCALKRELESAKCFYDLGANAGFFSLVAANLLGEQGRVVSFDPDPFNCSTMNEQIEMNNLQDRWSIEQKGIADKHGHAVFELEKPGSSKGHLQETGAGGFDVGSGKDSFEVELVALDDVIDAHPHPDVVKMDIEGAEILAMKGATRLLRDVRPIFLIELHGPESVRAVHAALREHNYSFFTIENEALPKDTRELPRHFIARPAENSAD